APDAAAPSPMPPPSAPPPPPLGGILHLAGLGRAPLLASPDAATTLATTLRPKLSGAALLHAATRHLNLDFFVLFSSAAAIVGGLGMAAYAAANAYLDALALARHAANLPATSCNWGLWAHGALATADQRARFAATGMRPMATAPALDALARAITTRTPQHFIAALDRPRYHAVLTARGPRPLLAALAPPPNAPDPAPRPVLTADPQQFQARISAHVARALGFGPDQAPPEDRGFFDLGMDSILATQLTRALAADLGLTLPATVAFDHPTVKALARHLFRQLHPEAPVAPAAARSPAPARDAHEPIAIIGIGCRFPGGVHDPDSLWQLLVRGGDAVGDVPPERWDIDAYYDPDPAVPGTMNTRRGGFLSGIDRFDAAFFGISPREAAKLDPQQRLLLEVAWEGLEHAGIAPTALTDSPTGVFVGLIYHDYAALAGAELADLDGYVGTGSAASVASGRLSYVLGLRGPSLTLDTACSSSLVALHLACQSLRAGECAMALAGGVTLMLTPTPFVEFSRLRGLAPDGRCKTFDAAADGVAWSEGCGLLVLKRLADAVRDGDRVLAVIRGTAVNQDGRSSGLTVPNRHAQEDVLRLALADAGLTPAAIAHVETHGTGTALGDPIEVNALGTVLGEGRSPDRPLVLGAVKANLGHTQAAAGVAGVIKTVLALQHAQIPGTPHVTTLNPRIPWSELPVTVATAPIPWPAEGPPRLAGVSSFGISGTNAHVILEEAPRSPANPPTTNASANPLTTNTKTPSAPTSAPTAIAAADILTAITAANTPTAITAANTPTANASTDLPIAITAANTPTANAATDLPTAITAANTPTANTSTAITADNTPTANPQTSTNLPTQPDLLIPLSAKTPAPLTALAAALPPHRTTHRPTHPDHAHTPPLRPTHIP
ncbi:MAG: KR domain-containing protein, partial [Myxococcales bacterium]|nr:KR domain-containing protein [Myxococcales bacterium]